MYSGTLRQFYLQYIVGAQECTLHNVHTVLYLYLLVKGKNHLIVFIIVQMQLYLTVNRQYI